MTKKRIQKRCAWAESNEIFFDYHDREWGVPVHDDHLLFEMLNLEGAQAGLSWLTILRKRENYRHAFDNFDALKISKYTAVQKKKLLKNEGIVRNRLKIDAVVDNARAFLTVREQFGTFDKYIWHFSGGKPVIRRKAAAVSETMSRDLKKRGFRFVGPTICYAFMQATGILNDHAAGCFRRKQV